jgi:hypothetical protein
VKVAGLFFVRYGLPAVLVLIGLVILLTVDDRGEAWTGWAGFTGAGISGLLLNVLHRTGHHSHLDREADEAARRHFDEHGRWPEEK